MDEKRNSDSGMDKEDESSKQGTGGSQQPGQGGQGGSTQQPGQGGQGGTQGIQPGKGESTGSDWNKEPAKGTDETES
ncbi:MAG: hypothetical protein H0W81_12605 [Chloroflexi bacterium]|nr:hypothetical protein [Chloroflexota bacterium]